MNYSKKPLSLLLISSSFITSSQAIQFLWNGNILGSYFQFYKEFHLCINKTMVNPAFTSLHNVLFLKHLFNSFSILLFYVCIICFCFNIWWSVFFLFLQFLKHQQYKQISIDVTEMATSEIGRIQFYGNIISHLYKPCKKLFVIHPPNVTRAHEGSGNKKKNKQ